MCRSQIHVVHDSAAASWPAVMTRDLDAAAAGCILTHNILPGFSDQELAIRHRAIYRHLCNEAVKRWLFAVFRCLRGQTGVNLRVPVPEQVLSQVYKRRGHMMSVLNTN